MVAERCSHRRISLNTAHGRHEGLMVGVDRATDINMVVLLVSLMVCSEWRARMASYTLQQ